MQRWAKRKNLKLHVCLMMISSDQFFGHLKSPISAAIVTVSCQKRDFIKQRFYKICDRCSKLSNHFSPSKLAIFVQKSVRFFRHKRVAPRFLPLGKRLILEHLKWYLFSCPVCVSFFVHTFANFNPFFKYKSSTKE